jgi:thiamine transporter ThiT
MSYMVFLPIKVANKFSTHYNDQVSDQLPGFLDKYLFTLCWASFSELGSERLAFSVAYNCSLYKISVWYQLVVMQINRDVRPNIIDTPLKLIVRM